VIDLQELLDRRAGVIEPSLDALDRVMGAVRTRHLRRRAMAWGSTMIMLTAALTTVVVTRPMARPRPGSDLSAELLGTAQALAVRSELGIEGPTKGAPNSVIVTQRAQAGRAQLSLVHVRTGKATSVAVDPDGGEPTISPRGDVVAAVSRHAVVLSSAKDPAKPTVVAQTDGVDGQVSWDGTGSALFTRVKGQWIRVSNAADGRRNIAPREIKRLTVPVIPGGPILLSVSPGGAVAALFGITYPIGRAPLPHLYVGRFDGTAVSDPREIEIPPSALDGPMGWVGENAFLLAPGPGKALVVRTDGSKIEVIPQGMGDPCALLSERIGCPSDGPRLMGTNADGSLLFWRISAERQDPSAQTALVLFYKTWLDGTHGVRLGGIVGRIGPPVAPR
jgi:hypothetical protein